MGFGSEDFGALALCTFGTMALWYWVLWTLELWYFFIFEFWKASFSRDDGDRPSQNYGGIARFSWFFCPVYFSMLFFPAAGCPFC
jgi:hypothetical protein